MSKKVVVYGAKWCPDCHFLTRYLDEHHIAYTWKDLDKHPDYAAELLHLTDGDAHIPVVVLPDETVLIEPTPAELDTTFASHQPQESFKRADVTIVGTGPAGLTAALYTVREQLKTLVVDKLGVGGNAVLTAKIENYPGFVNPINGVQLMQQMEEQAIKYGAHVELGVEVTDIKEEKGFLELTTSKGQIHTKAVVLALGTKYKLLNVPGELENTGRGVHYCATCDGPFYKDKHVIVIGGGNSAVQEALFLTRFTKKITLISFEVELSASKALQKKLEKQPHVTILRNKQTISIDSKGGHISGITMQDRETQHEESLLADGVFIFVGLQPQTEWLPAAFAKNEHGFLLTDATMQTKIPGVFVAGDCRAGATCQVASAVGEGASAALQVRHFLGN